MKKSQQITIESFSSTKKSIRLLASPQQLVTKYALSLLFASTVLLGLPVSKLKAQTLAETEDNKFRVSGYLRSGLGESEGGGTQAHFQIPGALNKFSLGNQADTYGELEFDYTHYLNKDHTKSIDAVWMSSIYEDFSTNHKMNYNKTEQLYLRANNLFGNGEILWAGKRFYDRYAIHMLDRQWINPGHGGWGAGIENLLKKGTTEDLKFGAWSFQDKDVTSYRNNKIGNLYNYTIDTRWVHVPLNKTLKLNMALNYTYRAENKELGYEARNGFGAFSWLDYEKGNITNTTAVLFRQGSNVSVNHWTGQSVRENSDNSSIVKNNLSNAYTLELNNNFLYDDMDKFAFNGIFLGLIRNYGTAPYQYNPTQEDLNNGANITPSIDLSTIGLSNGKMLYWMALGGQGKYYVSKQFRLTLELTSEFVNNGQVGATGNLSKISFSPEFSLAKGFYSRPVLRPLITYAKWTDGLVGHVGTGPGNTGFADKNSGFTYGLQFEIWW